MILKIVIGVHKEAVILEWFLLEAVMTEDEKESDAVQQKVVDECVQDVDDEIIHDTLDDIITVVLGIEFARTTVENAILEHRQLERVTDMKMLNTEMAHAEALQLVMQPLLLGVLGVNERMLKSQKQLRVRLKLERCTLIH